MIDIINYMILENGVILGALISALGSLLAHYYTKKTKLSIEAYEKIYDLLHKTLENDSKENGTNKHLIELEPKDKLYSIYKELKDSKFESRDEVHTKFLINLGLLYLTRFNTTKEKSDLKTAIEILNLSSDKIDFKSDPIEYLRILMTLGELQIKLSELENKTENLEKASKIFRDALKVVNNNSNIFESKEILEYLHKTSVLKQDSLLSSSERAVSPKLSELIEHYIRTVELQNTQSHIKAKGLIVGANRNE